MWASNVIQLSSVVQLGWVISSCFHSATSLRSCTTAVASTWGLGSFVGNWKWHLKLPTVTSFHEWMVLLHAVNVQHDIGNTKTRPIWLARSTRLANPVWIFSPSGSPLSAMRSTLHREDVTDIHLFLLGSRLESRGFIPPFIGVHGLVSLDIFLLPNWSQLHTCTCFRKIFMAFFSC
jgi:hypothetical protein